MVDAQGSNLGPADWELAPPGDLVALAQRHIWLFSELEDTRNAICAALMNGSDGNPTRAGKESNP
jgi:hypothetical protein